MATAGRPSIYSEELANTLCRRLVEGESLNAICKTEGMPGISTVFRWLGENPAFRDKYTRAKSEQADTLADEILSIADEEPDANRARVRIDARKWVAAKLKPKSYGEKLELAGDPDRPMKMEFAWVKPSE
jgi:hypothetical protein